MKKFIIVVAIAFAALGMASAAEASSAQQAVPAVSSLKVYNNMFSTTLDGASVDSTNQFHLIVPTGAATIVVKASAGDAKVEGLGSLSIKFGANLIPFTVTSADGVTQLYYLNINRIREI